LTQNGSVSLPCALCRSRFAAACRACPWTMVRGSLETSEPAEENTTNSGCGCGFAGGTLQAVQHGGAAGRAAEQDHKLCHGPIHGSIDPNPSWRGRTTRVLCENARSVNIQRKV
jgi:hypothetical protein